MLACPRSSWTYLGCLPAMSSIVAHVWRRSCSLVSDNPALLSRGLKCLPKRFAPLMVVPVVVGKTSPLSCQREPNLSFSSACLARWRLRASAQAGPEQATEEHLVQGHHHDPCHGPSWQPAITQQGLALHDCKVEGGGGN